MFKFRFRKNSVLSVSTLAIIALLSTPSVQSSNANFYKESSVLVGQIVIPWIVVKVAPWKSVDAPARYGVSFMVVSQAVSYDVLYSKTSDLANAKTATYEERCYIMCSKEATFVNAKSGEIYYVKIRANGPAPLGEWSEVFSVTMR